MKPGNGEIAGLNDPNYPGWEQGVRQGGLVNFKVMNKNLLDFKRIMDKHNIPFVAIFGTLLGFIREKRVIPASKDADFFCYASDHHKIKPVIDELISIGFHVLDRNASPFGDHHIIRGGEKIEIWWYQKIGNQWVYDDRIRYDAKYFDSLDLVNVLGVDWKVPFNPRENLLITYGERWKETDLNNTYILDGRIK